MVPMASNSSIKIIAGAFSLAKAKASLTILAPSPINIYTRKTESIQLSTLVQMHTSTHTCTNCGPASFKKVDCKVKKENFNFKRNMSMETNTYTPLFEQHKLLLKEFYQCQELRIATHLQK